MQNVHLTYPQDQLLATVDRLDAHLKRQTEEVSILDYGYCQKQDQCYVVLAWPDEVDEAFLTRLNDDPSVLDYCVYTVPCDDDDLPFGSAFPIVCEGRERC